MMSVMKPMIAICMPLEAYETRTVPSQPLGAHMYRGLSTAELADAFENVWLEIA